MNAAPGAIEWNRAEDEMLIQYNMYCKYTQCTTRMPLNIRLAFRICLSPVPKDARVHQYPLHEAAKKLQNAIRNRMPLWVLVSALLQPRRLAADASTARNILRFHRHLIKYSISTPAHADITHSLTPAHSKLSHRWRKFVQYVCNTPKWSCRNVEILTETHNVGIFRLHSSPIFLRLLFFSSPLLSSTFRCCVHEVSEKRSERDFFFRGWKKCNLL